MKLGIRGRLFFITLVVIAVVDLLVGVYLEHEVRASMDTSIRAELTRHANSGRTLLEQAGRPSGVVDADAIADAAAAATASRITVVTADGTVIGDSELSVAQIATVENHADRPELVEALGGKVGMSTRFSDTLATEMLYVAVPVQGPDKLQSPANRHHTGIFDHQVIQVFVEIPMGKRDTVADAQICRIASCALQHRLGIVITKQLNA